MENLHNFDFIPNQEVRDFRRQNRRQQLSDDLDDDREVASQTLASLLLEGFDLNNNGNDSRRRRLQENTDYYEKIRALSLMLEAPSNNTWQFVECGVCCLTQWTLVRSCCSFPACLDCLRQYYTSRVRMGSLAIECIGNECTQLVYRSEVNIRLNAQDKALYTRTLLAHSSESEYSKPCPQCNRIMTLNLKQLISMKKTLKKLKKRRFFPFHQSTNTVAESIKFR